MRAMALTGLILVATLGTATAVVPDVNTFRVVPQYPDPAPGATIVAGAATARRGELVLWDGETVYLQELILNVPGPLLNPIATGFTGDPSFVDLLSNDRTVIMGDGAAGVVLRLEDVQSPIDFQPANLIPVVTHFSGVLLNDNLLALDRMKDDMSGAEIVVVDLAAAAAVRGVAPVILGVLDKPAGSSPAAMTVDPNTLGLLVMDATTRELRRFSVPALIAAFTGGTPLDWVVDGLAIGAPGDFLNGGVLGVNTDRELILGGNLGVAGSGGLQFVDQGPPTMVLATLDPAGTGPAFSGIYNARLDEVVATDPSTAPPTVYASENAIPPIPPESPCLVFDEIDAEFLAFLVFLSPTVSDLDADGIPDAGMLELMALFSCRDNAVDAIGFATNTAYDINRTAFAAEASATALANFSQIVPALMLMNTAMQNAVRTLLSNNGTPLTGIYTSVSCTDLQTCLPVFVEDPNPVLRVVPASFEPYFGSGDPDDDGLTNLEEYMNVVEMNGDIIDFAIAAASEFLDGGSGIRSGGGGCFIATATYGSPLAAELGTFRRFRDATLLRSAPGSVFADAYYRLSPPVARWIAPRESARAVVRILLSVALSASKHWGLVLVTMLAAAGMYARTSRPNRSVQRRNE